ncbi:hypothetical protein GBA65_14990 [Rubrobacter marinus]|uniref:Uncharacterized protein n=1 Tax=Rubrobacter marinus TaxID=2653852 RepID=A0A6G8PZI6_9ACTN|nr:hypothetical protein [Rubrobacter marinus]QIN79612.1 hypothetical protein GBA65_14990 [Rubrobacter marinus]
MGLREHNGPRLRWWLDADYPNRIQGRIDPETPMDKTKRGGNVLLNARSQDRIDAYYEARRLKGRASDEQRRRALTDDYLLGLWLEWLPEQHPLRASAARQVLLSENAAGGMVELERLEKLVKDSADKKKMKKLLREPVDLVSVRQVCELARDAFEKVLEQTVSDEFMLEVDEDIRASNRLEAHHQDRTEEARNRDGEIRERFAVLRGAYHSQPAAVRQLAAEFKRDRETVRAALRKSALWGVRFPWEMLVDDADRRAT